MRDLTANEHAVLAHMVVDPNAWWSHANMIKTLDPERVLTQKVARHQEAYDEDILTLGVNYKNRAEIISEEDSE